MEQTTDLNFLLWLKETQSFMVNLFGDAALILLLQLMKKLILHLKMLKLMLNGLEPGIKVQTFNGVDSGMVFMMVVLISKI